MIAHHLCNHFYFEILTDYYKRLPKIKKKWYNTKNKFYVRAMNMRLIASSSYLPKKMMSNKEIAERFKINEEFIEKRTGIKQRYFAEDETIEYMATKATLKLIEKTKINVQEIGLLIVATTSTNKLMPGISNYIQKELKIKCCICLDILSGCSGYINAVDIAQMYINSGKVEKAVVVGVDILSKYTDEKDLGTAIILSDGAGATLLEASKNNLYYSNIESIVDENDILTCKSEEKIKMEGLSIYKYAVKETTKNITKLLKQSGESLENIKYIVPHQSNLKIITAIANRLGVSIEKMFTNIDRVGNTFCASIPIALEEMQQKKMIKEGDKIIFLGYGGGLNTGSILIKI